MLDVGETGNVEVERNTSEQNIKWKMERFKNTSVWKVYPGPSSYI